MIRALASVAAAASVLAGAPVARAVRPGVAVGRRVVTLSAPGGARLVISRRPFGLTFMDRNGHVVLRELVAHPAPLVVPGAVQSEFGTIGRPGPALYAPLGFLVGGQTVTLSPAGQWEGTLQTVAERGTEYFATAVRTVAVHGAGVRLTLNTNDPSGRVLVLGVSPGHAGNAFELSAQPRPAAGVATMEDSFLSSRTEAFHGFGGRHNSVDQRGSEFYNWLQQENVASGGPGGLFPVADPAHTHFMFPNGALAAYYVQSSFISSAGYGFLLRRDELSHWRLDSDRNRAWQTEVFARRLDYTVVPAPPPQAVAELTRLTGRQPVPPAWAAGSIFDREVKFPSDPPAQYAREVQSDIDNIDRRHLHVDAYRIEGWTELPGSTLRRLISELRARGIHPLLYFRCFVSDDSSHTDFSGAYAYATAHHLVATRADGTPYTFSDNYGAPAAIIDFTNPAAVRWWRARITAALRLGADGFMQDFGEQVLLDMHFHDGSTGAVMHNRYPVLYDRATRRVIDAWTRRHAGRHVFFFTRAGYSGTPGDAAFESANFPGDETTDWTAASGLASLTPDMLGRAVGGAYGYGTDIGGYFDVGPYQPTTKELFLRWAEWAALSPLFRLHGSVLHGVHTPWSFDRQTLRAYVALTALHLRARPLILRLWREADRTGMPITRPLWLAYPADRRAAAQQQEWMLGPDVLVAPVVTEGARARQVYFPSGCWVRPGTGVRYRGPVSLRVAAALTQLPYFSRCGARPFAAR